MNNKQRKTLRTIFEKPDRADIAWDEIESLLKALGAQRRERAGSRVHFSIGEWNVSLHRPHPAKELKRYHVRDLREFLSNAGIEP